MEELKERILKEGHARYKDRTVLLGTFLNHQIDAQLMMRCAEEFVRLYKDKDINKIVTIEASGIAPAILVGYLMNLPVVFIKKSKPKTVEESWESWVYSFFLRDHDIEYHALATIKRINEDNTMELG